MFWGYELVGSKISGIMVVSYYRHWCFGSIWYTRFSYHTEDKTCTEVRVAKHLVPKEYLNE